MKETFLNFSFEGWPAILLSLSPALVNIGILIYVQLFIKRSSLSITFLFFLLALILWRMQEVVLQICITREAARSWYHLFSICTNFIGATGLHFVLELVNKEKEWKKNYHLVAIYLPTFLFSMFFASGIEYMRFEHSQSWGWMFTPSHPLSIAAFVLIGIHASLMMVLLAVHTWRLRNTGSIEYKRLRIILIGSSSPILVGCTYQILLPIFFNYDPIPIASAATIFFSAAILIAITKYDLLEFSPAHQWMSIVENMSEGLLIVDNENRIQYVNPKFCELLGYSASELLSSDVSNLLAAKKDRTASDKMTQRIKKLFRNNQEEEMKKKDGCLIICQINSQPYLDSGKKVIGTIMICSDVTERKEAEKKIRENENRYRSFVEQASDGIFIADQKGNYLEVNKTACELLGYTKQELVRLSIKDLMFEDDYIKNPPRISELLEGKSVLSVRPLKRKDGSSLHTEINAGMLPDGKLLGIIRDITERKKAEDALLEKVNEMDAFIYRASHDLRGPLASISGLTSLGKEEIKDPLAFFYFDKIYDSSTRLDDILQELSKIARVTQAKVEPVEIDLQKEISEIFKSLQHLPNFSRIEFITEIENPKIFCDKILLIIVLQNLIINAINYYDEKKEKPFVLIRTFENMNGIKIVLSDNGTGIAPDIQKKVFEMFYRGTNTSKGSGLGLYIVKNAVKKLSGSILLESKEGEGTTFSIDLPKGK